MRIREDTAHYLLHLDDDAAYYGPFPFFSFSLPDPRTRSMRGGQAEFAQKRSDYAGESFVRASSEVQDFRRTQQFAWEASQKGSSVHVEAQPTATALLQRQVEERKRELEEMRRKKLEMRYGINAEMMKKSEKNQPEVRDDENYVEYDRQGKVVRGLPQAIPKSKYEEDLFPGNHSSVWGSWYNREEEKWGYACCHQCVKNAYCLADQA
ncbi:uncharacterized protein [Blastocystis hominis]|uniref:Pre-mRNA-splicing factor SLU7 n=1 Tax=Blastocystis hominis TaxID=12968 RepID=D8LZR5_BLAHO|nr:uncharacterized protein [Blastocystis hominis]CBK21304.2 unnamed protein product [Blastocystis hominis]|eukprot:XP_012895352.1 uncharacterized protein [Blastocystis hominis]